MSSKVITQKGKPFNLLQSKKKPQINIWHKLIFLSPVFIIAIIFKANDWYCAYQLTENGIECYAKITNISSVGVRSPEEIENVEFEFKYNDTIIKGYTLAQTNSNYAYSDNGMPLFIGDEFIVKYVKDNPDIYELNYNKPSKNTIENYFKITLFTLTSLDIYPISVKKEKKCECLVKNIYEKFGINGLATIFFNNELIVENISHNSFVYKNFMSKKEVKELIKKCEN